MKNRTLYTAGLILSTLGINAQQKVGITYQVEYRDGITNERIYRTPHSVITELIDGVATATVTEIANLPKGYKLVEGQEATITQTVTKGQTNILTFRVKTTDQSTKLEEGTELRRIANGTRDFSWSAGTNPSFEYVIPENLGGFEHVRRDIRFNVSIANNPFLQGGNNNNWNYHILDFERIQEADLRDYIADSYIQTRHPFIYLTTTGTTPQWGSSDNPAASRILGNTWSNNTRELQLGFDLAIHHLVPTGTYSFPIRLWYPLQQGQTYWTTSLKDQLVFEIKVINNYLKFNMEQTRLTTAPSNKSQADDLAQSHTVSGTTNLESGAQIRFKNQNGTILGNTTVGTNGRWSATITGLKSGDTLTAEIGRAGYYFMSDTLLVEDGSAPHVPNATVSLYRGESYLGKVLTAQDNLAITSLTTNPASPGAGGSFSVSGGDLNLTGTVALEPNRTNPNATTTSTYTVTARDGGNRTGTGTLTIQLKPQTDAYTATARTGLSYGSNDQTPQATSLLTVSRSTNSNLPTKPANARYEFVGAGVNMNQIGEQTVKVKVTYADGSTDEVDVTVTVRDTTAPTGTGVTWTRYRGEAYGSTPFFTAEDNVNVAYMSYGQGTSPVSTDNSFPTSTYRRGNSSTSKRLVIIVTGNVPLDATPGTTRYVARFADVNPASLGNESADIVSTLTIKEQTEAYTATAKTNVSVAKGTRITEADLINIVKSATDSTLPTPAADGRITVLGKTTTYSVTSGSLDTTSPGTKNVTILITYPDGSTSTVSTSFTVTNQAPTVATPSNIIVWKDQTIQNKITVTANDPDGNLTNALFKTNTVANAPANLNGIGVSTTGTNIIIEGTPIIGAGKYTRRLEVIDNNNTPALSNPFEIYILSAENRTLTLTSRATATEEQVKTEALRGITGISGNDTITATVVGTIPSARDTNRTVQVDLKTSTNETKRITVTLEYPANQAPTVDNVPDIAVWAGQKIQNPVSVAVNEPDGTIVSVRPRLNTFPMPDGTDARVENGRLIIDGTPASTLKAEDNLRRLILRDNDGAEVMTNQFNITVMKANDQTINRTTRTAPSQTDIIDIVRTSIEGTDTAKAAVNIAVGSIPTPVQADAGNKTVQVRLTTSSGENKTISITINYPPAVCTKPAITTGTALETIVGISDSRTNTDEWPHSRKGGWIALESNNKGFVINRLSTAQIRNITHPQEGMIAYDTTEKCIKIFNGTEWKCFSNPVCPQFK